MVKLFPHTQSLFGRYIAQKTHRFLCLNLIGVVAFFGFARSVDAQISFSIKAPSAVPMGKSFQVIYELKNASGKSFSEPSISGFDLLFGPAANHNDYQEITSKGSYTYRSSTYTYTLMPRKEGIYIIPAATVNAAGRTYTAKAISVRVLSPDKTKLDKGSEANKTVSAEDLYMRLTVSRTKVYEQEGVLATLKLFAAPKVEVREVIGVKLPDFDGFVAQEIANLGQRQWQLERVGNRNMKTVLVQQWVLLPQRTGQLAIPIATIDLDIAIPRSISPTGDPMIDNYFNQSGANYSRVRRTISTVPLTIDVEPLPAPRPTDFKDAVGYYTMKATSDPLTPRTGEAFKIILTIRGSGNIKLLPNPIVKFPDTFDPYDSKAETEMEVTPSGASGVRTIEYLAVPREVGQYTIPPISLIYFDTSSRTYKTISTETISVNVSKGSNVSLVSGDHNSKKDVKLIGQDIRYLKPIDQVSPTRLACSGFIFSPAYWLIYAVLCLAILLIGLLVIRHRKLQANVERSRHRNAGKMATKRLKKAKEKLNHEQEEFYFELLQAIWGYLRDKLRLSTLSLSRENIAQKLFDFGADEDLVLALLELIDQTDYAQYAPSSEKTKPQDLYDKATLLINRIENIKTT